MKSGIKFRESQRNIVKSNENGLIFKEGSSEDLKNSIREILSKKVKFVTLKAKRTLNSIPELKSIIEKYENSGKYKKIILISNQNFANIISSFSIPNNPNIKTIFIDRNHLDELSFYKGFKDKIGVISWD